MQTVSLFRDINQKPEGFPPVFYPQDNYYTAERWQLGRDLFYDKRLSIDSSISCGTCHIQSQAFADQKTVGIGQNNLSGTRNVPSLYNIGYHPYFMREGGVPTLEMQVLVPIQEVHEFGFNTKLLVDRLTSDSLYNQMSLLAYGRSFDAYVLTRAIANFERTLFSGTSKYDQNKKLNRTLFTKLERDGEELFFSDKTQCSVCHSGINFTNYSFENNGALENYMDVGRYRLTQLESDKHLFKVPSLRNVAITKPYMHNGTIHDLEDVIQIYNAGGYEHTQKSKLIRPLNLSEYDIKALVAFLETLTDYNEINDVRFAE